MKRDIADNPGSNRSITLATYVFASTGASGAVNASGGVDVSALEKGQSVFLGLTGASANGFTKNGEYFVIPVSSGAIKLATTRAKAFAGTYDVTASGNAGSGTLYPNYSVGGVLFIGTTGNINVRGIDVQDTGTSTFSLHKNIANASTVPFMLKDISASGTTASDMVVWN